MPSSFFNWTGSSVIELFIESRLNCFENSARIVRMVSFGEALGIGNQSLLRTSKFKNQLDVTKALPRRLRFLFIGAMVTAQLSNPSFSYRTTFVRLPRPDHRTDLAAFGASRETDLCECIREVSSFMFGQEQGIRQLERPGHASPRFCSDHCIKGPTSPFESPQSFKSLQFTKIGKRSKLTIAFSGTKISRSFSIHVRSYP
jgi:hypothetical protein